MCCSTAAIFYVRREGNHRLWIADWENAFHSHVTDQYAFCAARAKASAVSGPTITHCTIVNAVSITR